MLKTCDVEDSGIARGNRPALDTPLAELLASTGSAGISGLTTRPQAFRVSVCPTATYRTRAYGLRRVGYPAWFSQG